MWNSKKSAWEKYWDEQETEPAGWASSFEKILNQHLEERENEE